MFLLNETTSYNWEDSINYVSVSPAMGCDVGRLAVDVQSGCDH